MTIQISNLTVNNNAPQATIIGVLAAYDASGTIIPCTFTLTKNSAGFFAVSGYNLVTAFSGSISPGIYSVRVRALGPATGFIASAIFNVSVIASPSPPPPPPPPPPPAPPPPAPPPPTIAIRRFKKRRDSGAQYSYVYSCCRRARRSDGLGRYRDTKSAAEYRNRIRLSCNRHDAAAASWHYRPDLCNPIVACAERYRELRSSVLRRQRCDNGHVDRQSAVRGEQPRRSHAHRDHPISGQRHNTR